MPELRVLDVRGRFPRITERQWARIEGALGEAGPVRFTDAGVPKAALLGVFLALEQAGFGRLYVYVYHCSWLAAERRTLRKAGFPALPYRCPRCGTTVRERGALRFAYEGELAEGVMLAR